MLRRFLNMIVRKNDVSYRMFFLDRVSDILATLKVLKPKKTFLKTFQTLFQKLVFFSSPGQHHRLSPHESRGLSP